MTDTEPDHTDGEAGAPAPRRGPDLLTLAAGLGALGISVSALLGGFGWLPGVDARWVLAAVAILVGLVLVIGSIRPRRS
ncbi:MAG: hypothetical protein ACRDSN_00040 [Pseudonocardiaceae bacterium]